MIKSLSIMASLALVVMAADLNRVAAMSSAEMESAVGGACFIYKSFECGGVIGGCQMIECTLNGEGNWSCGINERRMKRDDYDNVALGSAGDEGMTSLKSEFQPDTDPRNFYPCVSKEPCVQGVACVEGWVWRETTIEVTPGISITVSYITIGMVCSGAIPIVLDDLRQLQVLDGEECTVPNPDL